MNAVTTETKVTIASLVARIDELTERVAQLENSKTPNNAPTREMTDDDARRILTGDLAKAKHKDAASTLGCSYGQVYSCRLEYTFKHIHKEMKEAGTKNEWAKS